MRLLLVVALMVCAVPCFADSYFGKWNDPRRVELGVRLEQRYAGKGVSATDFSNETLAGVVASYALVPRLSVSGRALHDVQAGTNEFTVGLSYAFFHAGSWFGGSK